MDPLTLIVTALAAGAAAGLKPTAEQAVKDAYEGLKALIRRKYSRVSIDMLENDPGDETRRAIVQQDLANAEAAKDTEVLQQAQALVRLVETRAPEVAASIDLDLAAMKVAGTMSLEELVADGDVRVGLRGSDVGGDVSIRNIRAGKTSDPDPKA